MFQNMLMTTLTPLSDKNEIQSWENRPFATVWPEAQQQYQRDTNVIRSIKKKSKRFRTAFTTKQLQTLERTFAKYKYITSDIRKELSQYLNIGERQIKIWFQNRRMKEKRDSSESSCDSSSDILSTMSPPLQSEEQRSDSQVAKDDVAANYMAVAHKASSGMAAIHNERSQILAAQTAEYHYMVESFLNQNIGDRNIEQTETSQYQLPDSYYNVHAPQFYHYQYPNVSSMVPNMHFVYDTNIYPTQYYPNDSINYSNGGESQYTLNTENYLNGNIYDLSYF